MKLEARFPFKSEFDVTKSDIRQEILRCALKKRKGKKKLIPGRILLESLPDKNYFTDNFHINPQLQ